MSWALHESRSSAGGNGGAAALRSGAAALRSGAAALAILGEGVGRGRGEWGVGERAHARRELNGEVRARGGH